MDFPQEIAGCSYFQTNAKESQVRNCGDLYASSRNRLKGIMLE
jgi:hypothetical protein